MRQNARTPGRPLGPALLLSAMATIATVAFSSAAAAQGVPPSDVEEAREAPVFDITADEVEYVRDEERLFAVGDVRIRSGSLLARALAFEWDGNAREGALAGGVVVVDGQRVVTARELEFNLETRVLELHDGRVQVKREVSSGELLRLADSDDPLTATRPGRNGLTLRACRIAERDDGSYVASDVRLTTCDCKSDGLDGDAYGGSCRPFLGFSSGNAVVTPDDAAVLWWPLLRIFDVPVLPLPPIVFPLSDRRTGLLFPLFTFNGPGGLGLEQPLFITLGESADITWRGGWFFGTEQSAAGGRGFSGFAQDIELRWAPAERASGRVRVSHFIDRSPVPGDLTRTRGNRFEGELRHAQELLGGRLNVEGALASDAGVLFDTEVLMNRLELPYLRSSAGWSRPIAAGGWQLGTAFQSAFIQSLEFDRGGPRTPIEQTAGVLSPVATATVQGHREVGSLLLGATGVVSREAAVPGLVVPEGRTDRIVAGFRLSQTLPLAASRFGFVSFEAGERVDLLARTLGPIPMSGGGEGVRAGAFAGFRGGTRLSRTFGGGWQHRIDPGFRVRGFLATGGARFIEAPFDPRDRAPQSELDTAIPEGATLQAVARLATSLGRPGWDALSLYAEHHLGVEAERAGVDPTATSGRVGQFTVGGATSLPPLPFSLRIGANGTWDVEEGEWASASATLSAGWLGASLWARGMYVGRTDRFGQGADMLFATASGIATPLGAQEILEANVGIPLPFGIRLSAGANQTRLLDRPNDVPQRQLTGNVFWDAGGCASISVGAVWNPESAEPPVFNFAFQLGELRPTDLALEPNFATERITP